VADAGDGVGVGHLASTLAGGRGDCIFQADLLFELVDQGLRVGQGSLAIPLVRRRR
jgi:hypothetical protein